MRRTGVNASRSPSPLAAEPSRRTNPAAKACLFLTALTILAYLPVLRNDFVEYDDQYYITENPQVRTGLSKNNFTWALTAIYAGNWHPLTWWSLQLDAELFGLNPMGFHASNVVIHTLGVLLLFGFLFRSTGEWWPSVAAAAVFAVHPLRVESVAWAAERKDVLGTFFWMLTLWVYSNYVRTPGVLRYSAVVLSFAVGLTAKPMLVTLPFVLVLLDFWPLKRWNRKSAARIVLDKLPLLTLVVASCVVTLKAQQVAVQSLDHLPLDLRLGNAAIAAVQYLVDFLLPIGLAVFYPHQRIVLASVQVLGAMAVLMLLTVAAIRQVRSRPYLVVGWLWYLGTLVPVIGLVQVGGQGRADRYTYIPLVGITIAAVWLFAKAPPRFRSVGRVVGPIVLALFVIGTWVQIGYWKDTVSLWTRTIAVTADNYEAHRNLAAEWDRLGNTTEAVKHYETALKSTPNQKVLHNDLGTFWLKRREYREARRHFESALALDPENPLTRNNLGGLFLMIGKPAEAEPHLRSAISGRPDDAGARFNLAMALAMLGRWEEADYQFTEGWNLDTTNTAARHSFGVLLRDRGRTDQALAHLEKATQLRPEQADYWFDLAVAWELKRMYSRAVECYRSAVASVNRPDSKFLLGLAHGLYQSGDKGSAAVQYRRATQLEPAWQNRLDELAWRLAVHPDAGQRNGVLAVLAGEQICQATDFGTVEFLDTLSAAYAEAGRFPDAIETGRKALAKAGSGTPLAKEIGDRIRLYEAGKPFRAESKSVPAVR